MLGKTRDKIMCFILPCEENAYRPKLLDQKILYCYVVLLLALKLAVIPFFVYLPKTSFFADITETSLISLANQARESLGFDVLKENQVLDQAALMKAQDMINNDYFSHQSPKGVTPWHWFDKAGYDYRYAGENLAIGFIESVDVNDAWMESSSHRQNILNPSYKEIGIAVLTGDFEGRETTVVVQLFGSQRPSTAKAQNQSVPVSENSSSSSVAGEETQTETENQTKTENQTETEAETQTGTEEETSTPSTTSEVASGQRKGEVLSSFRVADEKDDFMFRFLSFMASGYYDLLQKVIYGSLAFVAFLLINTVVYDIFVYHAYQIQYKDIFFKSLVFCVFLAALLAVDKDWILHLVYDGFTIL
jgi:hypothetical protein